MGVQTYSHHYICHVANLSVGAGKLYKYVTGKNSTFIHVIFVIFMLHLSVACKKQKSYFLIN